MSLKRKKDRHLKKQCYREENVPLLKAELRPKNSSYFIKIFPPLLISRKAATSVHTGPPFR